MSSGKALPSAAEEDLSAPVPTGAWSKAAAMAGLQPSARNRTPPEPVLAGGMAAAELIVHFVAYNRRLPGRNTLSLFARKANVKLETMTGPYEAILEQAEKLLREQGLKAPTRPKPGRPTKGESNALSTPKTAYPVPHDAATAPTGQSLRSGASRASSRGSGNCGPATSALGRSTRTGAWESRGLPPASSLPSAAGV